MNFIKKYLFFIVLGLTILCSATPFFRVALAYDQFPLIFPTLGDIDHNYYYVRIHEVLDGHLFLGNPFYIEHVGESALAFSGGEWLAAIPMVLGASFVFGLLINAIVWPVIFFVLVFKLLRELYVEEKMAIISAFVIFLASFSLILRPVAMQIVFPVFLIFCIAFVKWLKKAEMKTAFFLIVTAALNFYTYAFSWQIVVFVLIFSTIIFFLMKKRELAINMFLIGLSTVALILPVVFYTIHQMLLPLYSESVMRTALAITRIPTGAVIIYGAPLIVATIFALVLFRKAQEDYSVLRMFIYCFVPALFAAAVSNIVTAQDPELASHIGRYMVLVAYVILLAALPYLKYAQKKILIFSVCLVVGSSVYIFQDIARSLLINDLSIRDSVDSQAYYAPLQWLENRERSPVVVLANPNISGYVPAITKHYVVFSNYGLNHILTNEEQIERYILSQFDISKLTETQLKNELRIFAGTGPAIHQYKAINRRIRICRMFRMDLLGYSCGEYISADSLLGFDYYSKILSEAAHINKNISIWLDKYHVTYLIIDQKNGDNFAALSLFKSQIYDDGRFQIWQR